MKANNPRKLFKGFRISKLAKKLGIDRSNFYKWDEVPLDYVTQLEAMTGIPKEKIRPDYFK